MVLTVVCKPPTRPRRYRSRAFLSNVSATPYFIRHEPNDHSWIHDSNELTTLELYASFSFKATETSLLNEFETVDSSNQGLVSIFVSPVNDAPSGVFHVVEYFGREEGKSFQIEFRDDDE